MFSECIDVLKTKCINVARTRMIIKRPTILPENLSVNHEFPR